MVHQARENREVISVEKRDRLAEAEDMPKYTHSHRRMHVGITTRDRKNTGAQDGS